MTTPVASGLFQLDPAGSTVAIRHKSMWGLMTVKGTFTTFSGKGEVDADGTASGTVALDAASLDTGNDKRDTHLRSDDFFAAERYPTLVFTIREATPRTGDSVAVNGELTIRGITRALSLTATLAAADARTVTLTTEFPVDRAQYDMTWNQMGMMRGLTTVTATLRFTRAS